MCRFWLFGLFSPQRQGSICPPPRTPVSHTVLSHLHSGQKDSAEPKVRFISWLISHLSCMCLSLLLRRRRVRRVRGGSFNQWLYWKNWEITGRAGTCAKQLISHPLRRPPGVQFQAVALQGLHNRVGWFMIKALSL